MLPLALLCLSPALAAPQAQITTLAGVRAAPESTILLPTAWEGRVEPAAVGALDGQIRFGAATGPWFTAGGGTWAYVPEGEASSLDGRAAVGWSGPVAEGVDVDVAGNYKAQWYPMWALGVNGRGELLARVRIDRQHFSLTPELGAVDRRYLDAPAESFSEAHAGLVLGLKGQGPLSLDLGLGGQGNQAHGIGSEGRPGTQIRGLSRLNLASGAWTGALEYRLSWALQGEAEHDVQPLYTPWSDYSDDADALSGGGFVQHRLSFRGAVAVSRWTLSAGAMGRLRLAGEDELASAYARTGLARLQVDRDLGHDLSLFASVGAAAAESPVDLGYVDAWGWVGLRWRLGAAKG
ncbi:MAG: hypothetical protein GXP62_19345 [Oligoflexia bacterium]|nr:hypothetical protein [Oligoflexia bacterium]